MPVHGDFEGYGPNITRLVKAIGELNDWVEILRSQLPVVKDETVYGMELLIGPLTVAIETIRDQISKEGSNHELTLERVFPEEDDFTPVEEDLHDE